MTKRARILLVVGVVCVVVIAGWIFHLLGYGDSRLKLGSSLALVCRLYGDDHDGKYPLSLGQLSPEYVVDLSRTLNTYGDVRYVYVPGRTRASPPGTVLFYSAGPVHFGFHYVVSVDGSGKFVTKQGLQELLRNVPPSAP